jgi:hypothetical protein
MFSLDSLVSLRILLNIVTGVNGIGTILDSAIGCINPGLTPSGSNKACCRLV